ncbi:MAG TPA: winged helix-turn-helix domain-containing protein, partial [Vicinamibacterales bacterium]|nr:winged helix-turn-helix domain-containing protein [Vicinamibacterales bacterium]
MQALFSGRYRFGPFTLDTGAYRLIKGNTIVQVSPKIVDLLLYLVARPSVLVSKEELFRALWPDVAVTDNALTQAVSELRQALGDDSSNPKYVQTVARRGYRFIAPVAADTAPAGDALTDSAPSVPSLPAVGVLDFTNVSHDAALDWLSSGIAETVTNDLRSALHARTLDRTRIVEASRRVGTDLDALRRELHLDLAVVGSFQRSGDRLRITARAVDAGTGEALADSKADGLLTDVFDLQDRIVAQLSAAIGSRGATAPLRSTHETSSLEAYQVFTEGRVRLETLEGAQVTRAIADFERAIALDPRYAAAHVGLGNAHFFEYEMSRANSQPDAALLARAIDHVRRAIELDRDLAEAHATLSFLLVSAGRASEALVSARRAVTLEPGYWGHHFRVAHAAWGDERLRSLARVMELYPDFPFAHFEAAMVFIARGSLDRAESLLREGAIVQDRQVHLRQRFPARGLHWLLGLVRLALEDVAEAEEEFAREIAGGTGQLYGAEFVMNAHDGAGFARLRAGDPRGAERHFKHALELFPSHARSLVGIGAAMSAAGRSKDASTAFQNAAAAIEALRRGRRGAAAAMTQAFLHTTTGHHADALQCLHTLFERAEAPFAGWTIPVEPLLEPLRALPDLQPVLDTLATRAR